jgi:hypothetical protein
MKWALRCSVWRLASEKRWELTANSELHVPVDRIARRKLQIATR